jgi:hypothetical protein
MPSTENKERIIWAKAEWFSLVFGFIFILFSTGISSIIFPRLAKEYVLRKAQEEVDLSKLHLNIFPAIIDADGFVPSFYMKHEKDDGGISPGAIALRERGPG